MYTYSKSNILIENIWNDNNRKQKFLNGQLHTWIWVADISLTNIVIAGNNWWESSSTVVATKIWSTEAETVFLPCLFDETNIMTFFFCSFPFPFFIMKQVCGEELISVSRFRHEQMREKGVIFRFCLLIIKTDEMKKFCFLQNLKLQILLRAHLFPLIFVYADFMCASPVFHILFA